MYLWGRERERGKKEKGEEVEEGRFVAIIVVLLKDNQYILRNEISVIISYNKIASIVYFNIIIIFWSSYLHRAS